MDQIKGIDAILDKLPEHVRTALSSHDLSDTTEIVLRAERPVIVYRGRRFHYVPDSGELTDTSGHVYCSSKDIENTLLKLCNYSIYSYQNEIVSGYITIAGGVRVGLCGRAVIHDGAVTNVRDISTLSFRVPREIKGCANALLDKIDPARGVLICGSPGSGKTTLLRDIARSLSCVRRVNVLDERGELSAAYKGIPAFDLGLCDVYSGYPKGFAAMASIRSMAPEVIVCDELGDRSDADMLMYALRCGVAYVATVHASSMQDLRSRSVTSELIRTGAFRYIVFLSAHGAPGRIESIYEMRDVP